MKKALSLALSLALMLALTACSGGTSSGSQAQSSGSQGGASSSQGDASSADQSGASSQEDASSGESGAMVSLDAPLDAQGVEALADAVVECGAQLQTQDCAVITSYYFTNDEGTEQALADLEDELTALAEGAGYVAMVNSGEGDKVYALSANELEGINLVLLGEADSLKPGEESQGTRRFAQVNNLLPSFRECSGWQVTMVEEQDYYLEGEEQFPCYMVMFQPV